MTANILPLFQSFPAWEPPVVPGNIPQGDMPGDRISIGDIHIRKANAIFPELARLLPPLLKTKSCQRAVIAVCGGSGVGKSEVASLLGYYFQTLGAGSYVLSGDNYPHRIPMQNDAERLRIFRYGGVRALVASGQYSRERSDALRALQALARDADPSLAVDYPWIKVYQHEGCKALAGYLGSPEEIGFAELNEIISQFNNGADEIYLKRMGRDETALWYDKVHFCGVPILIIEWTHSNSGHYKGVDIPVLLNSTPQETLEYRRVRNRDGATDSPFTTMVLDIEQKQLAAQAPKAKIIVSKTGEILTYSEYWHLMAPSGGEQNA